jgi:hypothetical protein
MKYDRQLLLLGEKRNAVLGLAEVHAYGRDSYGDQDYVCLYGMRPAEWYARGIRLLGRTAVECTRDDFADRIGRDVSLVAARATGTLAPLVIDPFAGSGNTLYWLARHLSVARGVGFEQDIGVFDLTHRNLSLLSLPIDVLNVDYASGMAGLLPVAEQLIVAFVAPPWGDALNPASGLDLRRTYPPIAEITNLIATTCPANRLLFVVQVHESVNAESVADLNATFDWSEVKIYPLNAAGQNHGVLLGAVNWTPE